jgi:hypothetical protein
MRWQTIARVCTLYLLQLCTGLLEFVHICLVPTARLVQVSVGCGHTAGHVAVLGNHTAVDGHALYAEVALEPADTQHHAGLHHFMKAAAVFAAYDDLSICAHAMKMTLSHLRSFAASSVSQMTVLPNEYDTALASSASYVTASFAKRYAACQIAVSEQCKE